MIYCTLRISQTGFRALFTRLKVLEEHKDSMYAAINSDGYNVVLLFHLLTVIIGTGSAFLVQFINAKDSDILETASVQRIVGFLIAPSLFLGGVFGGALVGLSDDVYDFSQLWLTIAGVLWILSLIHI